MKINKKLEIGMNAIAALKKRDGFVRILDIAGEVGSSVYFLEQVMNDLKFTGLVNGKRGRGGGYTLNKDIEINAHSVALAVGVFTHPFDLGDQSSKNRLLINISQAFENTKL